LGTGYEAREKYVERKHCKIEGSEEEKNKD
jgi:hypothetical protein